MKEVGMLNRHIDSALNRQGHMDLMMAIRTRRQVC